MIEDNFFKWFYWEEDQRNVAVDGKSEMKGLFLTIFFLTVRALMHVAMLIEMVERRKRNQSCKKEGLIK